LGEEREVKDEEGKAVGKIVKEGGRELTSYQQINSTDDKCVA
jgi:hypothetical protein